MAKETKKKLILHPLTPDQALTAALQIKKSDLDKLQAKKKRKSSKKKK